MAWRGGSDSRREDFGHIHTCREQDAQKQGVLFSVMTILCFFLLTSGGDLLIQLWHARKC